jgi:ABC-type cobalamin/Fe3+-siderophores transport system ATPase subunit
MADLLFNHVTFGYGRPLFKNLSLRFEQGLQHALIGPNAVGKTTLFHLASGLRTPASGTVSLDETVLSSLAPRERARRLAVVPQFETNVFQLTVRQLVTTGRFCRQEGFFGSDDEPAVMKALTRAGAAHLADRSIWDLSGGERQRVLIARALAQETEWILLDEPTNFLDLRAEFELIRLLGELHAEGLSILAVTHDLQAAGEADRITLLAPEGAVQGTPDEILTADRLSAAYGIDLYVERRGKRTLVGPRASDR